MQIEARDYTDNLSLYHSFSDEEIINYASTFYNDDIEYISTFGINQNLQNFKDIFKKIISKKDWIEAELFIRALLHSEKVLFDNDVGYNFGNYDYHNTPEKILEEIIKVIHPKNTLKDIIDGFRFFNKFHTLNSEQFKDVLKRLNDRFTQEEINGNEKSFEILLFYILDKEFEHRSCPLFADEIKIAEEMDSKFTPILEKLQYKFERIKIINKVQLITDGEVEIIEQLPYFIRKQIRLENNFEKMAQYINKKYLSLNEDKLHILIYNLISRREIIGYYNSNEYNKLLDHLQSLGCKAAKMVQEIIELYAHCGFSPDVLDKDINTDEDSDDEYSSSDEE